MAYVLDKEELSECQKIGRGLALTFSLAFKQPKQTGVAGNWLGVGIGSSIDFQDHRPYLPGDDPRYINWQAYARTGHYTMKLYRDEVSPRIDIVVDLSPSMRLYPEKARCYATMLYYCIEYGLSAGAHLNCYSIHEDQVHLVSLDEIQSHRWLDDAPEDSQQLAPDLNNVPWKSNSIRILLSDLLFPGLPNEILRPFIRSSSWNAILCPFAKLEEEPDWQGGMQLIDSETEAERILYCDREFMDSYSSAYNEHFELWNDACRRSAINLARINSDLDINEVFSSAGIRSGAITI